MRNIIALLLLAFCINRAQTISVAVANINVPKVKLCTLSGEKTAIIDSNLAFVNNRVVYGSIKTIAKGFYKLIVSPTVWIDFVYEGKDVTLNTDAKNIIDNMKVIKSEENKLFYTFAKLSKQYRAKSELIQLILSRYPKDDYFFTEAKKRLNELQSEYTEFVNVTSQEYPDSFIEQYIRSAQLPVVDCDLPIDKQLAYLKAHALDNVDFKNNGLVNSDAFTSKTIEYLTYFRNPQLPKELLGKEFCSAIDSVLNRARINGIVYQNIVEYLIDGFKRFGFDSVLDYIVTNYVIKDDLCLDVKTEGMIKRRIDQTRYLKNGVISPEFNLSDVAGKSIQLSKLTQGKILLVFYSTQCPYCQVIMPKLNVLSNNLKSKNIAIIAICLDTKKEEWEKFVKEKCPDIINVSDLKGWDGQIVKDYYLYASPTMIILDKERKIIGKPVTYEEASLLLN